MVAGYQNIASVYFDQKDYHRALTYYRMCVRKYLSRDYPPPLYVAQAYNDIARVYQEQGHPLRGLVANLEGFRWLAANFKPEPEEYFSLPELDQVRFAYRLFRFGRDQGLFVEAIGMIRIRHRSFGWNKVC